MGTHNVDGPHYQFPYQQLDKNKREIRLVQLTFDSKNKDHNNESPSGMTKASDNLRLRLVHRSRDDHHPPFLCILLLLGAQQEAVKNPRHQSKFEDSKKDPKSENKYKQ